MSQMSKQIMKQNRLLRFLIIPLVLLMVITFTSCNRVTKHNYDKISYGMTIQEVRNILGQEGEVVVNLHNDEYYWFSDARTIDEALEKAEKGEYCDYIVVAFSVELKDNSQIVLNKKIGSTKEWVK